MRISVDTVACHTVIVCKYAVLHVVTIISWKTLVVTKKATFSRAFELLNFSLVIFT